MSVTPDPTPVEACTDEQAKQPQPTAAELVSSQSAGLATLMKSLGISTCTSVTVAGGSLFPPYALGGNVTTGCEQVSAIASALNASQKVYQCSFYRLQQTTSLSAQQTLSINFTVSNVKANCRIVVTQVSDIRVINYATLDSSVKKSFSSSLQSTMESFAKAVQDATKKGLFTNSDGQKAVQSITQNLNEAITQNSFDDITQNVLSQYQNKGEINASYDMLEILLAIRPGQPDLPCLEVNQNFVMQILSQSILQSALELLFKGDAKNDMLAALSTAQVAKSEGFTVPDFGATAIIVIIIIIALALLFAKKPGGEGGQPQPALAGPAGKIFGIILMVVGLILLIAGIVLLLMKKVSAILSWLLIIGGVIIAIVGLVMFLKARSQQTRFEQQLEIAKTGSKVPESAGNEKL